MKRLRRYVLGLVVLISTISVYAATTPSDVPNPKRLGEAHYVANPDKIINADDEAFLNNCANRLYNQTQVEMCVVALTSINNADAFMFAYELFQRWGIGQKGKNTGVLILFVLDSHDIRIMTGTGIEGILTDARCSKIIRDDMTPLFRAGDYGGGLCRGALRIYETCTDGNAPEELLQMKSVTNRGGFESEEEKEADRGDSWKGLIFLLFLIAIIYLIWKTPGNHSGRTGSYGGGSVYTGGGSFGGGSFSGGGFGGGFGGGSTSGGGAGGKW